MRQVSGSKMEVELEVLMKWDLQKEKPLKPISVFHIKQMMKRWQAQKN